MSDLRKIVNDVNYYPSSANDLCSKLFVTCYMATANNSEETKQRAHSLASQIGSTHFSILIDLAVDAIITIWTTTMRIVPRFKVNGGCSSENAALQNVKIKKIKRLDLFEIKSLNVCEFKIQARLRMVISYFFAQLTLWTVDRPGSLLVLGSANVDESLRGYFTKYDCSSADLNPIVSN